MAAPFKNWTVLPHAKPVMIGNDILTVTGDMHMPAGIIPRRMTIVRLKDGRLVIFSAVALAEDEMHALEEFGSPAFLVVPNAYHRTDAKIWKDRYPALTVIAPAGARAKVAEIVPVDATDADFGDSAIRLIAVPGTEAHEMALEISGPDGMTLVVNDIISNMPKRSGISGFRLGLLGFGGDRPRIPTMVRAFLVKDKTALATTFRQWAAMPSLRRILVAHGVAIEDNPGRILNELAATLT